MLQYEIYDDAGEVHKVSFEIVGIIKDMPSTALARYIFTSYKTSLDLVEKNNFVVECTNNSVLLTFDRYGYDEEKIVDLFVELSENYGQKFIGQNIEENEEKFEVFDEEGTYISVSNSFYVVCVLVFICMTIFIYNAISINMTEKNKTIRNA